MVSQLVSLTVGPEKGSPKLQMISVRASVLGIWSKKDGRFGSGFPGPWVLGASTTQLYVKVGTTVQVLEVLHRQGRLVVLFLVHLGLARPEDRRVRGRSGAERLMAEIGCVG